MNIGSDFYASQWLLTFFSIDLPFDIVFIAMDLFLLEGYSAFIRICLALLKLIQGTSYHPIPIYTHFCIIGELLKLDYEECLVYLKTFGKQLEADVESFYASAMSFKITKQMCKDLESFFLD